MIGMSTFSSRDGEVLSSFCQQLREEHFTSVSATGNSTLGPPTLGVAASHLKEPSLGCRALGRVAVRGVEKRRQFGLTSQPLHETERELHKPVIELFTDSDGAGYVPGVDGSIKCG